MESKVIVAECVNMQLKCLSFVEDPQLKLQNRIALQGYLNCARDTGVLTLEEFEKLRDIADGLFDLKKHYLEELAKAFEKMVSSQ